jgi:hypothetical protein
MLSLAEGFGDETRITSPVAEQQDSDDPIVCVEIERVWESMQEDASKTLKHPPMQQRIPPGGKNGSFQRSHEVVPQTGAHILVPGKCLVSVIQQPRADF